MIPKALQRLKREGGINWEISKKYLLQFTKIQHSLRDNPKSEYLLNLLRSDIKSKLENLIKMIKENYAIIIEDNTEKQNIKLTLIDFDDDSFFGNLTHLHVESI